jgi:hypothetical protein
MMRAISKLLVPIVITLVMAGCSNPKNYEIAKLTDDQKKEVGEALTAEEGQKLVGWTMRHALAGGEIPPGTTVGQALADQDKWAAEQKAKEAEAAALAARLEKERAQKQAEFAKLVSVAVLGKRNIDGEYGQKAVVFDVGYENKGAKDIEGIKGVLRVNDIFGDSITSIKWSYDDGVAAGSSEVERGSGVDINQFMDRDMKLWNTDFSKMKTQFEVSTIVFKDGTTLKAPE